MQHKGNFIDIYVVNFGNEFFYNEIPHTNYYFLENILKAFIFCLNLSYL